MMDKDKLRKADVFSGAVIFACGLWIVSMALKMPMKDSWGGVQNVWYVSPAIFPLFVGAMIMLLGGILVRTAVHEIGFKAFRSVFSFLGSTDFLQFLKLDAVLRFYGSVLLLVSFVFLFIPRVDFFLAAIEFLLVFILMFYIETIQLFKKMLILYLVQLAVFLLYLFSPLDTVLAETINYPGDILMVLFIISFFVRTFLWCRTDPVLKRKFRTSVIVAFAAPLIIGIAFKYFLLVPMPFEGFVVELLDAVWYM